MDNIITALIFFAIAGVIMVFYSKYKAKLISNGKMIQRDKDFAEYAEIFTLRPITDDMVANAISQIDFAKTVGCKLSGDTKKMQFNHMMNKYQATLVCTQMNDEGTVYKFKFNSWNTKYGKATEDVGMNMLLTSIEKMFLELDPNTQVSTKKLDTKTERDWI